MKNLSKFLDKTIEIRANGVIVYFFLLFFFGIFIGYFLPYWITLVASALFGIIGITLVTYRANGCNKKIF